MDFDLSRPAQTLEIPPIDFRGELNDEQFAAVTAEPSPLLILAGAGSGKTRTLTYRVAYLLSKGVSPGEILLLTFTNKAAKEMLGRVEDLTGIEARRFWGGTFHSIGHRLLRMHGDAIELAKNFTILDSGEAESILKGAVEGIDKTFFKDKTHPKAGPLASVISMARNTRTSIEEAIVNHFPQHHKLVDRIQVFSEVYAKRKAEQQVVDYDDLLVFWLKLMDRSPEIREHYNQRFRHTLVDEYQDTNTLQAKIVDVMGANHQIMAVGDDAQCIYSWRGANYENIMTFPDRHPDTRILRIETNYRSTPEILSFANAIIQNRSARGFDKELKAHKPSSQTPYVVQAMDGKEQAQFIITRIQGLLDEGKDPREIAVLYRAHYQALDLQMELSRAGIPYQITSGVRFFEQAHVKDIVAHLRLVYNPRDVSAFMRLAVLLPKIGEKSAQKLYDLALETAKNERIDFIDALAKPEVVRKTPAAARSDWESLAQSLQDMKQANDSGSPEEVLQLGIEGWYGLYLQGAYANYVNRLDDLRSLIGFAAQFDEMQDLISQITLLNSETSNRNIEEQDQAIRLTTVHQAKGLEYDVVFLIGAAEGLFPIRRAVESGDTEEERRLFYVAVTRARDELYLLFPKMNAKGGGSMFLTPSRFLQEVSQELYEPVRIRRNYGW
ncbi:MAG: DNA helicase UvrD [Opitutales bacterium TMED158]|nr:MAG: DNA helicase UvrD [Opitutales bacterium TMED158]